MSKVTKASIKRFFEKAKAEQKAVYLTHEIDSKLFSQGVELYTQTVNRVTDEKRMVQQVRTNDVVMLQEGAEQSTYLALNNDMFKPEYCDDTMCIMYYEKTHERPQASFQGKEYTDTKELTKQRLIYKLG
jgi:hypothetical protein